MTTYSDSFLPTLQTSQATQNTFRIKRVPTKSTVLTNEITQMPSILQSPKRLQHQRIHTLQQASKAKTYKQEEEEIKALLEKSTDFVPIDKAYQPLIGNEALQRYFKHYKNIDRIEQENEKFDIKPSLYTSMHHSSSVQSLLPCKVGVLKYEGLPDSIKIPSMKYGDQYMRVLSEGVKCAPPSLDIFQFEGNRISTKSSGNLLSVISKTAKELNFSKNRIGAIGIEHIAKSLQSRECRIEILELEDNHLGDQLVQQLCTALLKNSTVSRLNLSKNYISNGLPLAQLLSENMSIQELYLHWNQIRGEIGGRAIFAGLLNNIYLKVLDLSCNSLAGCSQQIAEFLIKNRELVHLDLSFNSFNEKESEVISEGLNQNQVIYGFHFQGNQRYVDSLGFLVVGDMEDSGHRTVRIDSCKFRGQQSSKEVCWICNGWKEHLFTWSEPNDPMFVHLDFQNYEGVYFGKNSNKMIRMVPAGQVNYFFSIGEESQVIAEDQPRAEMNFNEKVYLIDQKRQVKLKQLNRCFETVDKNIIDQYYLPRISVKPRTPNLIYVRPKVIGFTLNIFKEQKAKNNLDFPDFYFQRLAQRYRGTYEAVLRDRLEYESNHQNYQE